MKTRFVVLKAYNFAGDLALGVWDEGMARYELGDGDWYTEGELVAGGFEPMFLGFTELQALLARGLEKNRKQKGASRGKDL